jgi:pimeloyl-ACP methyl ester carboxylesterase
MLFTRRCEWGSLTAVALVAMTAMALASCAPLTPQQAAMPQSKSGFAEVNGTRLYYEIAGAGEPLVLLHGLGGDTRNWDANFDELARHYRTIRYDMRGYGQSSAPEQPYRHEDDLKALLDYLGISRTHVLGQSFGGGQALNFVLAHPEMVLSFVSVGGSIDGAEGLPDASPADAEAYAAMGAALQSGDLEGAAKAVLDMDMLSVARQDPELKAELVRGFADYFRQHGMDTDTLLPPEAPAAQRLGEVTAPSLYIIGEHDTPEDYAYADLFAANIPQARKVVIEGCDHVPNMEKPQEFNQTVLSFLAENAGVAQ